MSLDQFLQTPPGQVVKYPNHILRAKASPVQTNESLHRAAILMIKMMYQWGGIGLAAPQVGLPYQVIVMNPSMERGKELVLANIQPVAYGDRKKSVVEGCLSLPGVRGNVERPHRFSFTALGIDGETRKYTYEGLASRVVQHEYDHLCGKLIIDYFCPEELSAAQPILQQMESGYGDLTNDL